MYEAGLLLIAVFSCSGQGKFSVAILRLHDWSEPNPSHCGTFVAFALFVASSRPFEGLSSLSAFFAQGNVMCHDCQHFLLIILVVALLDWVIASLIE